MDYDVGNDLLVPQCIHLLNQGYELSEVLDIVREWDEVLSDAEMKILLEHAQ